MLLFTRLRILGLPFELWEAYYRKICIGAQFRNAHAAGRVLFALKQQDNAVQKRFLRSGHPYREVLGGQE
jgi:hypothetical protein